MPDKIALNGWYTTNMHGVTQQSINQSSERWYLLNEFSIAHTVIQFAFIFQQPHLHFYKHIHLSIVDVHVKLSI